MNIKVGDIVKIAKNQETFWTIVNKVENDLVFATIDNFLVFSIDGENYGDKISFEKNKVIDIYHD